MKKNNSDPGATRRQYEAVKNALSRDDGGFGLVVGILRAGRLRKKISLKRLASLSGVPEQTIERLEAGDFETARVKDLLLVSRALKCHAGVAFMPQREKPPRTNEDILAAFDRLLRSRKAVVFLKNQPDKEHACVTWAIVGDADRNWLYALCHNRQTQARFAAVTDNPGGWAIRAQQFGIDVETEAIARRMSRRLMRKHRAELI